MQPIDRLRDALQAREFVGAWLRIEVVRIRRLARRAKMRAGMRDRHGDAERFAAFEFGALAGKRLDEVLLVR